MTTGSCWYDFFCLRYQSPKWHEICYESRSVLVSFLWGCGNSILLEWKWKTVEPGCCTFLKKLSQMLCQYSVIKKFSFIISLPYTLLYRSRNKRNFLVTLFLDCNLITKKKICGTSLTWSQEFLRPLLTVNKNSDIFDSPPCANLVKILKWVSTHLQPHKKPRAQ